MSRGPGLSAKHGVFFCWERVLGMVSPGKSLASVCGDTKLSLHPNGVFLTNLHGTKLVLEQKRTTRKSRRLVQEYFNQKSLLRFLYVLFLRISVWFYYPQLPKTDGDMWLLLLWQVYGMDGIQTFPPQQNGTWNRKKSWFSRDRFIRLGGWPQSVWDVPGKKTWGPPDVPRLRKCYESSIWSFLWRKKDCLKDRHSFQVDQLYIEYLLFFWFSGEKKKFATHRFFGGGKNKLPHLAVFSPPNPGCSPQRQGIRIQAPGIQRHATRARILVKYGEHHLGWC